MMKQSTDQIELEEFLAELRRRREFISRGFQSADQRERKKWLALRKEAGRQIEPETAEVTWIYACTEDPYCINPELSEEDQYSCGREYFARNPRSDIWVRIVDLPTATREALREKYDL
jgi:hypothetical protein